MRALQHEQLESHVRNLRHGSANGAYTTGLKLMTHSQGVFFFFNYMHCLTKYVDPTNMFFDNKHTHVLG